MPRISRADSEALSAHLWSYRSMMKDLYTGTIVLEKLRIWKELSTSANPNMAHPAFAYDHDSLMRGQYYHVRVDHVQPLRGPLSNFPPRDIRAHLLVIVEAICAQPIVSAYDDWVHGHPRLGGAMKVAALARDDARCEAFGMEKAGWDCLDEFCNAEMPASSASSRHGGASDRSGSDDSEGSMYY